MPENQERKRTLWGIVITAGVGAEMLTNVFEITKTFYEIGEKIAPRLQEYVGSIGSGAVEYGLPGLVCLGTLVLGGIAVKATDQYLLNRRYNPEPEL
ncbi:MAG: hypothetical protein COY38_05260 [Candidatus Aenigmarchaeota archaeon CG_4_10_14_0_8_um_filter_37_24]|nr:MAG: hypothetical protein COY38_05260 [Candidatus Aenigmarchaeota archaeon CG_4_10_14_0_8_um_filter_37_24]